MAETLKTTKRIAELICGSGQCICSYKCGHSNKAPIAERLSLIGTNTVCPLAHFNVEPDTRPWHSLSAEEMRENQLTVDDCWRFCDSCPHSAGRGRVYPSERLRNGLYRLPCESSAGQHFRKHGGSRYVLTQKDPTATRIILAVGHEEN